MSTTFASPSPPSPVVPVYSPDTNNSQIVSWLEQRLVEGEEFLKAQPNYSLIDECIGAIMGQGEGLGKFTLTSSHSGVRTNRVKKIFIDLCANLTDIKPFWNYTTFNRSFEQHATNYSKLATGWYQRRNSDLRLGDVMNYYAACGTGYAHFSFDSKDTKDISMTAEDPRNVVPIAPTNYDSLESCLGVIVKKWVPVTWIESTYGVKVKQETNGEVSAWASIRGAVREIVSPIHKFSNSDEKSREMPKIPGVWIKTCYIKDYRHNTKEDLGVEFTNAPIEMGKWMDSPATPGKRIPANNWSYSVPVGHPLYPHRRIIMWVGGYLISDGPLPYWHGGEVGFPIVKVTLDPVPWSWFGLAPLHDLLPLQVSLNRTLRCMDNHVGQVANPGSVHDKNNVSRPEFEKFDTSKAGYKIYQNPLVGKGIQVLAPPPLDASVLDHRDWTTKEMDTLAGTADLSPLTALKQLPANSTVESIINAMTPGLRKRSRVLEAIQRQMAMILAYDFTQFYSLPMMVNILGPGGIVVDNFDYDPETLVPDFLNSDYIMGPEGTAIIDPERMVQGPRPRYERSREFLRMLVFNVEPGSLLHGSRMERMLMYFQLMRAGVMDPLTVMEEMGIPNIGLEALPPNVRTIIDRLLWCQQVGLVPMVSSTGRKASGQEPPQPKKDGSGMSESG